MQINIFYKNFIFKFPKLIFITLLIMVIIFGYLARLLSIDASSDTLILEGDKDLAYTQLVNNRYYSPNFLILAYTPSENLFSDNTLQNIESISLSVNFEENALSFLMASMYCIPLSLASNATL